MIRTLIQSRRARWAAVPALLGLSAAAAIAVCPPAQTGGGGPPEGPPQVPIGCAYPNSPPPVVPPVSQPSLVEQIAELKRICAQQQQSLQNIHALLTTLVSEVQTLRQAVAPGPMTPRVPDT